MTTTISTNDDNANDLETNNSNNISVNDLLEDNIEILINTTINPLSEPNPANNVSLNNVIIGDINDIEIADQDDHFICIEIPATNTIVINNYLLKLQNIETKFERVKLVIIEHD